MCQTFNARAYIRLNRCFWEPVAFEVLKILAEYMGQKNFHNVKAIYSTACGRRCYDLQKKWIVDVDNKEIDKSEIYSVINNSTSHFDEVVICEIPTPNGYHLITHPFDIRGIKQKYSEEDLSIHKNNPTVLYHP